MESFTIKSFVMKSFTMKRKIIQIVTAICMSLFMTGCGAVATTADSAEYTSLVEACTDEAEESSAVAAQKSTSTEEALEEYLVETLDMSGASDKSEILEESSAAPVTVARNDADASNNTNNGNNDGNYLSAREIIDTLEGRNSTPEPDTNTNPSEGTFDRELGEQIFALVNEDRAAAGLGQLTWNEELYDIAMQRCYENDVHAGMRAGTSENYAFVTVASTQTLHDNGWKSSPGHYANYMDGNHTKGAVAVLKLNGGGAVAYEVFQDDNQVTDIPVWGEGDTQIEYHRHGIDPYVDWCDECNPSVNTQTQTNGYAESDGFQGSAEDADKWYEEYKARKEREAIERYNSQ